MSDAPAVALFTSGTFDEDAAEWLRVLVAVVALGRPLRLLVLGPGSAVLAGGDLPSEALRHLDGLAAFGVAPATPSASSMRGALLEGGVLLRFADPARRNVPALVELTDAAIAAAGDEGLLRTLLDAGQVVRTRT